MSMSLTQMLLLLGLLLLLLQRALLFHNGATIGSSRSNSSSSSICANLIFIFFHFCLDFVSLMLAYCCNICAPTMSLLPPIMHPEIKTACSSSGVWHLLLPTWAGGKARVIKARAKVLPRARARAREALIKLVAKGKVVPRARASKTQTNWVWLFLQGHLLSSRTTPSF